MSKDIITTSAKRSIMHKDLDFELSLNYPEYSVLLTGGVGCGKSEHLEQFAMAKAKAMGRTFKHWNKCTLKEKYALLQDDKTLGSTYVFAPVFLSQYDASEFRIPIPDITQGVCNWVPSLLFAVLGKSNAAGMLFLDEFLNASPSVHAAAQQLFLTHAIGDITLNQEVFIIAASNRDQDNCNINCVGNAINNRFAHLELATPSVKDWLEGFGYAHGIDHRISAFLLWDTTKFNYDPVKHGNSADPFPTPRAWTLASDKSKKDPSDRALLACVAQQMGEDIAMVLKAYLDVVSKVNLDEAFTDPVKYIKGIQAKNTDGIQLLAGTSTAIIGHVNESMSNAKSAMDFACALIDCDMADFAAALFIQVRNSKHFVKKSTAEYCTWIKGNFPNHWKHVRSCLDLVQASSTSW